MRATGAIVTTCSRVIAVVAVVALVGLLPWLSGPSAEYTVLRARYSELEPTPEALARIRAELGLEAGPWVLLGRWASGLLRGDLGTSWITGAPVGPGLVRALGVSLTLMLFALAVTAVVAAAMTVPALASGLRFRPRRGSGLVPALLAAVPSFLLASILLVVVGVWLRWLPPFGWRTPHHAILPALALGLPAGAYLGRLWADAVTGVWSEHWTRTWALAGASHRRLGAAVLRRAGGSLVSQVALVVVGLTAEAVAVEEIFAIPGLGRLLLGAASAQDVPSLQAGLLVLLGLAVILGIVAAGLRRLLIGPGLRLGAAPVPRAGGAEGRRTLVVALTAFALLVAVVAWGLPRDPLAPVHGRLAAPSPSLPLGADAMGRDVLARVSHGAVATLGGAVLVTLATMVVGLGIGLLGRWSTGPIEVANALPSLIVGLVVVSVWGASASGAALAVVATAWAPLAAHTRDLVAEVRARPYLRLQPLWGVGPVRQLLLHVLPVVAPQVVRHAVLRLPGRALELASLSFLGLGARPPAPEWGLLLEEGIQYVERAPWAVLAPTAALMLASVAAIAASSREARGRTAVASDGL